MTTNNTTGQAMTHTEMNVLTFDELNRQFGYDCNAIIAFITTSHDEGLVEVIERTLPTYTLSDDRLVKGYNWNTYSFEIHISKWYDEDGTGILQFPFQDQNAWQFYRQNFMTLLNRVTKIEEIHWNDPVKQEVESLILSNLVTEKRINTTRRYMIDQELPDPQFDSNCRLMVSWMNLISLTNERLRSINVL